MVKNKIKSISLVLMLIIIAFSFFGCANVRVSTITNADNSIDELVSIELDEIAIVNAGQSVALLKEDIRTRSLEEAEQMCENLNIKIEQHLTENITEESKEILNSYKNGITVVFSDWENNTFTIGIRFANINVYKYYYNMPEESKIQYYVEEHFFYDKLYYYANTKYVLHNELYERMKEIYFTNYAELINSESNQLTYTYVTELRREHSDADFINKVDGKYYHTWIIDKDNVAEPVMIYYNVANAGNCILVCIGGVLGLTTIFFTIAFIINKVKNKNKEKLNKNI